jgi:hypothetical protein
MQVPIESREYIYVEQCPSLDDCSPPGAEDDYPNHQGCTLLGAVSLHFRYVFFRFRHLFRFNIFTRFCSFPSVSSLFSSGDVTPAALDRRHQTEQMYCSGIDFFSSIISHSS